MVVWGLLPSDESMEFRIDLPVPGVLYKPRIGIIPDIRPGESGLAM